jgi:pyridoxal phosphate enzyme (YggS family)
MNRTSEITANLNDVKAKIASAALKAGRDADEITLIVVTKTFPVSDLEILYSLGVREFGENRDQEAAEKVAQLPSDINWNFQGGIQSNKLKSITTWAGCIHSVDKLKYAQIISEQNTGKPKEIFIQVSLDQPPESRGGVDPKKLIDLASEITKLPGISLKGLMAVAPLDLPEEQAFLKLKEIQADFVAVFKGAKYLSAGMSGDYEMAISYGATHLRIGSSILGNR